MKFLFFIRSIIYISLEFLFAYGLEKSNKFYRKFFYILAASIIIFEIIKTKIILQTSGIGRPWDLYQATPPISP